MLQRLVWLTAKLSKECAQSVREGASATASPLCCATAWLEDFSAAALPLGYGAGITPHQDARLQEGQPISFMYKDVFNDLYIKIHI